MVLAGRTLFVIVLLPSLLWAQATRDATDAPPGIRVMVATGAGLDPDQAVKNALFAATEQAVGILVEAQVIVDHREVLQEKVITATNAFVEKYDVLDRWQKDGLQYARIKAVVRFRELQRTIQANNITTLRVEGKDFAAEIETKTKASDDAAEVVKNCFENLESRLNGFLHANAAGEVKAIGETSRGTTRLVVPVQVTVDQSRYAEFTKNIVPRLSHVAIDQSTTQAYLQRQPEIDVQRLSMFGGPWLVCEGQRKIVTNTVSLPAHLFLPVNWFKEESHGKIDGAAITRRVLEPLYKRVRQSDEQYCILAVINELSPGGASRLDFYLMPAATVDSLPSVEGRGVAVSVALIAGNGTVLESRDAELGTHDMSDMPVFLYSLVGPRSFQHMKAEGSEQPPIAVLCPGVMCDWANGLTSRWLAYSWAGNVYVDMDTDRVKNLKTVQLSAKWVSHPSDRQEVNRRSPERDKPSRRAAVPPRGAVSPRDN